MNKFQRFLMFSLLSSYIAFSSASNSPTPCPSNHSDETRSSDIDSQRTELNYSHRSSSESPQPTDPNPNSKEKESLLASIKEQIERKEIEITLATQSIAKILKQSVQEFTAASVDAFYGPTAKNLPSLYIITERIYGLGLKRPIPVRIEENSFTNHPCTFTPYEITIFPSFFNSSRIDQDLLLSEIIKHLNHCHFGNQKVIKESKESKNPHVATSMQTVADNVKSIALLKLLSDYVEIGDQEGTDELVDVLHQENDHEQEIPRSLSPANRSGSPRQKRLKVDNFFK